MPDTLPDIPVDDWTSYQSDQFMQQSESRIGALGFQTASDQQIGSLNDLVPYGGSRPPEDRPQAAPEQAQDVPAPDQTAPDQTDAASSDLAPVQPQAMPAVSSPLPPASPSPAPAPAPASAPSPSPSSLAQGSGVGDPGLITSVLNQLSQAGIAPDKIEAEANDLLGKITSSAPVQAATQAVTGAAGGLQGYAYQAAQKAGIDPNTFVRQIQQESGFNPNAKSPAGAVGIAQFMPATAQGLGIDPTNPQQALDAAANLMAGYVQKYGGDISKALAAYNAGPGNVDKYGGVPPFAETQAYVKNILGGAGSTPDLVAPDRAQARNQDISQFGNPQLTTDEAYAACGPAAAVRFAERFGRNPTLREAVDMAKQVGWTPQQGMAGLGSEANLMQKMGVPVKVLNGSQWDVFAQEAQTGNPVTISTTGHYFFADGYNPQTGAFHVGRSGLDLKGGSEWMTPQQMTNLMGPVQGGLLADNPTVAAPSIADTSQSSPITNPLDWLGQQKDQLASGIGGVASQAGSAVQQVVSNALPSGPPGGGQAPAAPAAASPVAYGGAMSPDQRMESMVPPTQGPPAPIGASGTPSVVPGTPSVVPATASVPSATPTDTQNPIQVFGQQIASGVVGLVQHLTGQQNPTGANPGALPQPVPIPSSAAQLPFGGATAADLVTGPLRGSNAQAPLSAQEIGNVVPSSPEQLPFGGKTAADVVENAVGIGPEGQQQYSQTLEGIQGAVSNIVQGQDPTPEQKDALRQGAVIFGGTQAFGGGEPGSVRPGEPPAPLSDVARAPAPEAAAATDLPNPPPTLRPAVLPEGAQPIQLSRQEQIDRLNLNQFPDFLRQPLADNAEATNFAENQRRGVLPTPVQQQLGQQLAQDTNVDAWISRSRAGQAFNTEQVRAMKNVVATQAATVSDLARQVSEATAAGQPADLLAARALAEGQRLQSLQQVLEGSRAEWGRAGQAWQAPANLMQLSTTDAVQQIFNKVGGRDNALKYLQEYNSLVGQGANPIQMAKFWGGVKNPPAGFLDWFRALRVGSMAGGLPTVVHIALNTPLQAMWKLATDIPEAVVTRNLGAIPAELTGLVQGVRMAGDASLQMLQHGITERQALSGDLPRGLAARSGNGLGAQVAENALLGLVKTHPAMQEAAYQVGHYMELSRQAAFVAKNEGLRPLTQPWQDRIQQLLSSPTDPMLRAADKTGDQFAFRGPMGTTGGAVRDFVNKTRPVGSFIMPFVGIPYHVATAGIERTPIGAVGTLFDVARARVGQGPYAAGQTNEAVTPFVRRALNNIAGTGAFIGALGLADQGLITDGGPSSPQQKVDLSKQGWQPDSIKVGDRYINGHLLGPLFYPLALAAGVSEAQRYPRVQPGQQQQPIDVFRDGIQRAVGFLGNETYLSSLGQFINAATASLQEGRAIERFGAGVVQSVIPQDALLRNLGQATDPYLRQVVSGDFGQQLQSGVPGHGIGPISGREDLPTRLDTAGQPMPNPQQGAGILVPRSTVVRPDPVARLYNDAGLTLGTAPKSIKVSSKDSIDLTAQEQRQVEGIRAKMLHDFVQPLVNDPNFANAPIQQRQPILRRLEDKANEAAGKEYRNELTPGEVNDRVQARRGSRVPQSLPGLPVGSR